MLPLELVAGSGFGTLLGMRHALEPDHLAAVSVLVNEERSSFRAALLGVSWGLGHTASLLVVGTGLIVIQADLPSQVAQLFELAVAVMMLGLGLRAISLAANEEPFHRVTSLVSGSTLARRPLLYGLVHGLAGSGALTALVLTTLPSTAARLTYMTLFGIGSTLGMAALSGLLGWPIARIGNRRTVARGLSAFVGCLSVGLGIGKGYALLVPFLW